MTLPTSPSLEAARAEVAAAVKAALDAWETAHGWRPLVEAGNRVVDLSDPAAVRPVLDWELKFKSAYPASLGRDPIVRQLGQLVIAVKVKLGAGTTESLAIMDFLVPYFELKDSFTYICTEVVEVQDGFERLGWWVIPSVTNFRLDRISPSS